MYKILIKSSLNDNFFDPRDKKSFVNIVRIVEYQVTHPGPLLSYVNTIMEISGYAWELMGDDFFVNIYALISDTEHMKYMLQTDHYSLVFDRV